MTMYSALTHWGRVTHIWVSKLAIIGSDNGLSPDRRQAIVWTNAGILLIGPLGTNFSEVLIGIQTFSFKKMHMKISSAKMAAILPRPQCVKIWSQLISKPDVRYSAIPDSKVHGANMGPIWGRQDPGGPHVGAMNFAIWDALQWIGRRSYWWPIMLMVENCNHD